MEGGGYAFLFGFEYWAFFGYRPKKIGMEKKVLGFSYIDKVAELTCLRLVDTIIEIEY